MQHYDKSRLLGREYIYGVKRMCSFAIFLGSLSQIHSEHFNITRQICYLRVNAQVAREIVRRIANRVCHNSFSTLFAIVSSITVAICLRRVAYKKNHVTRWLSEI